MGLKTTNYEIKSKGITVPEAYAKIIQLTVSENGACHANFKIQQTRDSMSLLALDNVNVICEINKSLPLYEQVYIAAKESHFPGWEDDIVEDDTVVEE